MVVEGIFKGETYPAFSFLADRIDLVVDVGANIGAASLFFSNAYPLAHVVAFEPGAFPFKYLEANTSNMDEITTLKGALLDRSGASWLNLRGVGGEGNYLCPEDRACCGMVRDCRD